MRLLLAALLISCGSPPLRRTAAPSPSRQAADAGTITPASSSTDQRAPSLPPDVANVAAIAPPAASGCVLDAAEPQDAFLLAARPDGVPFAAVRAHAVRVTIGTDGALFADIETGSARLRGYLPSNEPPLYAARSIVFGGVAAVKPSALIGVASVSGDKIVASYAPGTYPALTAVVSCADLALAPAHFDTAASFPASKMAGRWVLRDMGALLSATPGGPPFAFARDIDLLDRTGGYARVKSDLRDAIVVGWTPASNVQRMPQEERRLRKQVDVLEHLKPVPPLVTEGSGPPFVGAEGHRAGGRPQTHDRSVRETALALEELRCPSGIRLLVSVNGERFLAGDLEPSSILRVLDRHESTARIALPSRERGGLTLAANAMLETPLRDLAACQSQTATADSEQPATRPSMDPPAPPTSETR